MRNWCFYCNVFEVAARLCSSILCIVAGFARSGLCCHRSSKVLLVHHLREGACRASTADCCSRLGQGSHHGRTDLLRRLCRGLHFVALLAEGVVEPMVDGRVGWRREASRHWGDSLRRRDGDCLKGPLGREARRGDVWQDKWLCQVIRHQVNGIERSFSEICADGSQGSDRTACADNMPGKLGDSCNCSNAVILGGEMQRLRGRQSSSRCIPRLHPGEQQRGPLWSATSGLGDSVCGPQTLHLSLIVVILVLLGAAFPVFSVRLCLAPGRADWTDLLSPCGDGLWGSVDFEVQPDRPGL